MVALNQVDLVLAHFLPEGKQKGREYTVLNPNRKDSNLGNFKVNTKTGKWKDFAASDKGGNNLISLVAYIEKCSYFEAAKKLATLLGCLTDEKNRPSRKAVSNNGKQDDDNWLPVTPIAQNSTQKPKSHSTLGLPSKIWTYHNESGQPTFYVCRFEKKSGKELRPLTYCQNKCTGRYKWQWKGLPALRPLYNLHKLAAQPDALVIVVEGEKAADAAEQLFPDSIVTTSPHGAQSARQTDWSPLKGRTVLIWPDNDEAGTKYCAEVQKLCLAVGASVSILNIEKFACKPGVK